MDAINVDGYEGVCKQHTDSDFIWKPEGGK